ncbi:unnamed protein product, partial [Iphiclides podalirius]
MNYLLSICIVFDRSSICPKRDNCERKRSEGGDGAAAGRRAECASGAGRRERRARAVPRRADRQSRAQPRQARTMLAHALAAALLCALGAGASLHCAMRREISPCTCRREDTGTGGVLVVCQRISTYGEIAAALANKFSPETKIGLDISYSQLPDFGQHSFRELGLSITRLKLNFDNLRQVVFRSTYSYMCRGALGTSWPLV